MRSAALWSLIVLLWTLIPGPAVAYEPDEVRAILLNRPLDPPSDARRIVLASRRVIDVQSKGELRTLDHLLWMAGRAGPDDEGRSRWSYRPGIEHVHILEGWIHRNDGVREAIPADEARTGPCAAAGPDGYPGMADFVVSPRPLASGEVVELLVEGTAVALHRVGHYAGEHQFGGADSTIESELVLRYPTDLPPIVWWSGAVPQERRSVLEGVTEARWLLGHLPPGSRTARTVGSILADAPPDTVGPPVLLYAFQNDWERVVATRRRMWLGLFRSTPDTLVSAASAIASSEPEPERRLARVIERIDKDLAEIDLPAARLWFEPGELGRVHARGAAVSRDRAAATAWLLRRVGIRADVVSVPSRRPLIEEMVFPQQLDVWLVLARPAPSVARWLDFRPERERSRPLPMGSGVLWTAGLDEPPLIPFPGLEGERPARPGGDDPGRPDR
ncbi:MAG: DUF3857 domain-containing protein [Candidatus Eisenbacteria bacterium]|nr:DUF3857 domain-containing protein [Candidatus Eisenbacteria bacterium]